MTATLPSPKPGAGITRRPPWMSVLSELEALLAREGARLTCEFPHCISLPLPMSSPGVAYHLVPTDEFTNTGTFMMLLKYSPESDTITAECSMEINHQTVRDAEDSMRVAVADTDREELLSFVRAKLAQFCELYRRPQDLGPEEVPEEDEGAVRRPGKTTPVRRRRTQKR